MSQASHAVNGNQSGNGFRIDLNTALEALVTLFAGPTAPNATAPSGTGAQNQPRPYMLWADTTSGTLKMRNAANDGWIVLGALAGLLSNGLCETLVLQVLQTALTSCTVTADQITVGGSYLSSVSTSVSTAASAGAGGIDTGAWAANTWYAIHLICNSDGSSVNAVASTNATTPTLPGGYTRSRRVGWVRCTGTGPNNLRPFRQDGPEVLVDIDESMVLAAGTATSQTDVDVSASVPPGVRQARLYCEITAGSTNDAKLNLIPKGSGNTTGQRVGRAINGGVNSSAPKVLLDANRVLQYKLTNTSGSGCSANIGVHGWTDNAVQ